MCGLEKWFRGQSAYLVRKKPWAWHHRKSGMGRYTPVISVLGMWKQGDQELKASLGYTRVGLKRTKPEGLRKVTPPYLSEFISVIVQQCRVPGDAGSFAESTRSDQGREGKFPASRPRSSYSNRYLRKGNIWSHNKVPPCHPALPMSLILMVLQLTSNLVMSPVPL